MTGVSSVPYIMSAFALENKLRRNRVALSGISRGLQNNYVSPQGRVCLDTISIVWVRRV